MDKLFIFGIDALDYDLLLKYINVLPNFKKLISGGYLSRSQSVFPPDSDTVWSTIYTGLSPAEHGVVNFVDPLSKSTKYLTSETDNSFLHNKTFWDVASRQGKKVIVLFPHVGFPPWEVNGIMVSRSSTEDIIQAYPKDIKFDFDLNKLKTIKGFPSGKNELKKFINKHYELINNEAKFSSKLLKTEKWDLFFVYSSSLDVVKHFVWKYCDENDPSYPGNNELEGTIRDLYLLYDKLLGRYLEQLPSECSLIVLSDHGHGGRPQKLFNINEFLRRHNFLQTVQSKNHTNIVFMEKFKRLALDIIGKYELGKYASNFLKIVPSLRKLYTSPLLIDWNNTVAYTSDLSGIKAYSYGGIVINRRNIEESQYEEIRDKIISLLSELKQQNSDRSLFGFIMKREELYEGEFLHKYPDIVFNLNNNYGAGWEVNGELFSISSMHSIVPGSHKSDSAVFIKYNMRNSGNKEKENIKIMDVSREIWSFTTDV